MQTFLPIPLQTPAPSQTAESPELQITRALYGFMWTLGAAIVGVAAVAAFDQRS